jgi:hypothetical protein
MPNHEVISEALELIFKGIEGLTVAFPQKKFTIDGRLVGDVGEVIAALEYDVILHEKLQANFDGKTSDGRDVQIKATFKNHQTFKTSAGYYLGFKLSMNGDYEEIFNGPARIIYDRYSHLKGIGVQLVSIPIQNLRDLTRSVDPANRVPKQTG